MQRERKENSIHSECGDVVKKEVVIYMSKYTVWGCIKQQEYLMWLK
jgi:hypothetical protein